ncbi:Transmembrane protein 222 [Clonorchis sinensis]|uniref:Transmembrane protein 222 n=1 Tax=Clonorchis sinensis TaxID=79923 RepID=A0A8T1LYW5_CLOSI|nr:Transmembrane protein 222 [Clonorchis sinensis]
MADCLNECLEVKVRSYCGKLAKSWLQSSEMTYWLEREFTGRKVRGSNQTSASHFPLSRLWQPCSITALVLPSDGLTARHRSDTTRMGEMLPTHEDRIPVVEFQGSARSRVDQLPVSPHLHRFPHSLVWTPIPLLTWLFPIIGHMGITNTAGIIYDFAAPYTICEDNMAFGWPTMYCQLDLSHVENREMWDKAVFGANEVYKLRVHNLFCDNCYSHVARALNGMRYRGRSNWNMFSVTLLFFSHARYVNLKGCLASLVPFVLILGVALAVILFVMLR